jgi:hypothetical protein
MQRKREPRLRRSDCSRPGLTELLRDDRESPAVQHVKAKQQL